MSVPFSASTFLFICTGAIIMLGGRKCDIKAETNETSALDKGGFELLTYGVVAWWCVTTSGTLKLSTQTGFTHMYRIKGRFIMFLLSACTATTTAAAAARYEGVPNDFLAKNGLVVRSFLLPCSPLVD